MTALDLLSAALCVAGAGFFAAGTAGLLRFPDVYSRLHALAKADNAGLGLTVLGLAVEAESITGAGKLVLIWLLALAAGATGSQVIAQAARRRGRMRAERP